MPDIDGIISVLKTLDRPIPFQRAFVTLAGDIKAALLLSHAVARARADNAGGWMWRTHDEWERETGLSQKAQLRALKILRRKGLKGIGADVFTSKGVTTGHIFLNWTEFGSPGGALDPKNKNHDRTVAFHREFVTLTGAIDAALMLSHAVYLSRNDNRWSGWFPKKEGGWRTETGLTWPEQCEATHILRNKGLLLVDKKRVPHRVFYRVDAERLQEYLQQMAATAKVVKHA